MAEPRDRMSPMFSFGPIRRDRQSGQASPDPSTQSAQRGQVSGDTPPDRTANAAADLRQWAGASRATLAIAFTDVVSSAALGNKLGDRGMDAVRRTHFAHVEQLVRAHDGFVIKTIGDSVMAGFRAATNALDFALAVHADPGDRRIRVRVGVHVGPVTVEQRDAHGVTVNYASRVAGAPKDAEVWLSSEARTHVAQERAPQHEPLHWQPHGGLVLKGFPGKHILWSVAQA
ncbi:MAG TPA: adenylate/guanylate cyclase domain-containing protein [Phycisphaerae bacterium]|nr:adenylate/guanylate cyclase domain-containing protein [Phycisphaerae bacterium]